MTYARSTGSWAKRVKTGSSRSVDLVFCEFPKQVSVDGDDGEVRLRLLSAEYPVGVSVATSVFSGRMVSVTIRNGDGTIASAS